MSECSCSDASALRRAAELVQARKPKGIIATAMHDALVALAESIDEEAKR